MDLPPLNIDALSGFPQTRLQKEKVEKDDAQGQSFSETLKSFLQDVNQLQKEAGEHVEALIAGETVDLHDVMIAVEKASVSFEMVMEIRNKILEAYQELMRTQV
ncbi:MAG: flagellar hook-basal body complex protein FliE [candidate division KSB1 bacterium]|nr:flagellar hook-basal body complex protein FliE [candidate division KSB1 bacterium]